MTKAYSDEAAAALVVAGRLLQSKDWSSGRKRIERAPGESYPAAVERTIQSLSSEEKAHLRELVAWVRSYEKSGAVAP